MQAFRLCSQGVGWCVGDARLPKGFWQGHAPKSQGYSVVGLTGVCGTGDKGNSVAPSSCAGPPSLLHAVTAEPALGLRLCSFSGGIRVLSSCLRDKQGTGVSGQALCAVQTPHGFPSIPDSSSSWPFAGDLREEGWSPSCPHPLAEN